MTHPQDKQIEKLLEEVRIDIMAVSQESDTTSSGREVVFEPSVLVERFEQLFLKAKQIGVEEERERVVAIVQKWMDTSNPAHAQDLFDELSLTQECFCCGKRVRKSDALKTFGSLGTYYYHFECLTQHK